MTATVPWGKVAEVAVGAAAEAAAVAEAEAELEMKSELEMVERISKRDLEEARLVKVAEGRLPTGSLSTLDWNCLR